MNKPIRIQRRRTKGFNLQAQSPDGRPVVSVCRPGKWGNPFQPSTVKCICSQPCMCHDNSTFVAHYRVWLAHKLKQVPDWLEPLRGKHLACFCKPTQVCHADVLLELANEPGASPATTTKGGQAGQKGGSDA